MVSQLANSRAVAFKRKGVIGVDASNKALVLPSGLPLFYEDLVMTSIHTRCGEVETKSMVGR